MRAYTELISEKTHYFDSNEPFTTEFGSVIPSVRVAYRTWGTLNARKDNVVLICQALTGSADADGWWEGMFPGEALSTKALISSSVAMCLEAVTAQQALYLSILSPAVIMVPIFL